jgi:alkylation response protein AidB-like acyl-CoA dehydrogenase
MHSTLSPELEEHRSFCRAFAERHLRPYVERLDAGETFPPDARRRLGELGAYGLPFPESVGGGGGTFLAWAVLHEELARVLPVAGLYFQVSSIAAAAILEVGTPAQHRRHVPALFAGTSQAFLAFTEPDTGSDIGMLQTRARPTGDGGWVVNGRKMWISNAASADVGLVFALVDQGGDPTTGVGTGDELAIFLVDPKQPGFIVGNAIPIMGVRGTELHELLFEDLAVGPDGLLTRGRGAFDVLRRVMSIGKIGLCAMCVGLMQTCLEEAVRYARHRRQRGHPILDFQAIHHLVAEMVAALEASRQLTYWAATCRDQGIDAITELATAKLFVTNAALRVARQAVSVHGVYGIAQGATVERLLRDAQVFELLEGPSEVQRELVMRAVRDIV